MKFDGFPGEKSILSFKLQMVYRLVNHSSLNHPQEKLNPRPAGDFPRAILFFQCPLPALICRLSICLLKRFSQKLLHARFIQTLRCLRQNDRRRLEGVAQNATVDRSVSSILRTTTLFPGIGFSVILARRAAQSFLIRSIIQTPPIALITNPMTPP